MPTFNKKQTLEQVQLDFHEWRKTKRRRCQPTPDHLWNSAVALADEHSVNKISKILKLEFSKLNHKANRLSSKEIVPSDIAMFEIPGNILNSTNNFDNELQLETHKPDGAFLRVHIPSQKNNLLCDVVNSFMGG